MSWELLFFPIAFFILFFYLANIYKLYKNISEEKYSFMTLFRVGGIFFPILGFFLGFV